MRDTQKTVALHFGSTLGTAGTSELGCFSGVRLRLKVDSGLVFGHRYITYVASIHQW